MAMVICCLLVLAGSLAVGQAKQVRFKDCGSQIGAISKLDVTPCNEEPCIFQRGTNETLGVAFHLNKDVVEATAAVTGIFGRLRVPFPLPNPHCCEHGGLTCPLKGGVDYTYTLNLPVKTLYPEVSLVVELKLLDQDGEIIICFLIPVKIH